MAVGTVWIQYMTVSGLVAVCRVCLKYMTIGG